MDSGYCTALARGAFELRYRDPIIHTRLFTGLRRSVHTDLGRTHVRVEEELTPCGLAVPHEARRGAASRARNFDRERPRDRLHHRLRFRRRLLRNANAVYVEHWRCVGVCVGTVCAGVEKGRALDVAVELPIECEARIFSPVAAQLHLGLKKNSHHVRWL